jgi:enoyl-CoA hydratase
MEEKLVLFKTLAFQKKEGVGVVEMNWSPNEDVSHLADDLAHLCNEIFCDDEIRVIILTGGRKDSFSIEPRLAEPRSGICDQVESDIGSFSEPLGKLDQPVIAAINGDAIGHGLELALACDIRIAMVTSRFGLPHIKTGLIPRDGGTQRLPRLVGRDKALEMILTGEMIEAQEAYRIGLVNKIVPPGELITVAMDMAKEMASKGPIALRYAKEAIYKGMDVTLEQGLRLEADLYLLLHTTRDRTEGINAFRKKRTPKFEGR